MRPLTADEGGGWLIEYPDLPGCVADGETVEQALANGRKASTTWIATAHKAGRMLPPAGVARSGKHADVPGASVVSVILPGLSNADARAALDRAMQLALCCQRVTDLLHEAHTAPESPVNKQTLTVLALLPLALEIGPDWAVPLVRALSPPFTAQIFERMMRGIVAAAFAHLHEARIETPALMKWLQQEIENRTFKFTAVKASKQFYRMTEKGRAVAPDTVQIFEAFKPDPKKPRPTEAEAKQAVAALFKTLKTFSPAP